MAHIRIHLLLLVFAVSLSHAQPKYNEGEYFPALGITVVIDRREGTVITLFVYAQLFPEH